MISIVAPAYNEAKNIAAFLAAITPVLDGPGLAGEPWEIVFVDDGSTDDTLGLLVAARSQEPRVKIVALARNFGKDVALSAGLKHAQGAAVIPIDCDLQHPVELIPAMILGCEVEGRRRHGDRRPHEAQRGGLRAPQHGRPVLRPDEADDARRDSAKCRRLPSARSQDCRRDQRHARAVPLHEGNLRVARLQDRDGRVPGQPARCRRDDVEPVSPVAIRARRAVLVLDLAGPGRSGPTTAGCRRSAHSSTSRSRSCRRSCGASRRRATRRS